MNQRIRDTITKHLLDSLSRQDFKDWHEGAFEEYVVDVPTILSEKLIREDVEDLFQVQKLIDDLTPLFKEKAADERVDLSN